MTTGNIKFSQLPDLPLANITSAAIAPAVENNTNYKVSFANIASFVNNGGNITATTVSATGNITGNYILGNGSQLTGLPATYGNANVATYLASGNVTSNVITTGNIQGAFVLGNGSQLTGLPATYGNANVATYLASGNNTANIVTTGNVSGNYYIGNGSLLTGVVATLPANITGTSVSVTGNITGAFFVGNGSALTGIAGTYSNANVSSYLASGVTSNIITTGNVTATNFIGSGATLTSLPAANIVGTVANATYAANAGYATTAASATTATTATSATSATTAVTAGTVTSASQPTITSLGTLTGLTASGNISTTGNITGNYHIGNGSLLTGVTSTLAQYVTANAQANITSVGTLTSLSVTGNVQAGNIRTAGIVSATGNVSGSFFIGNGSALTGIVATSGVTSLAAGAGITLSGSTGNVTITNSYASPRIAQSFTTGAALGNVETISKSVLIAANTFSSNDVVRIVGQWEQGNSAVAFQGYMNIYINTANSIPSSTQNILFTFTPSSAGPTFFRTQTFVDVIATTGNTRVSAGGGGGSVLNYTSATGYGGSGISPKPTYMSIDWTQPQYIIFTTYSSNNSYNFYCTGYQIYKE